MELAGSAEDGQEALNEILRLRPDVAVLDVLLMSGPGSAGMAQGA